MTELEKEIAHLQELQAKHRQNIRTLEEMLAEYGMDRPLKLVNELEFEQKQLRQVEERLAAALAAQTGEAPTAPVKSREVQRKEKLAVQGDWDVFISHAWEDKETFARPLAKALEREGLRVWYDEFTLRVGDSLRRSIDHGLANSKYGVVILSPNFFAKEWPQKELDGLAAREVSGEKVILPVWHNVTAHQIRKYSPTLADRVAVLSDRGLEYVVGELLRVIKPISELERQLFEPEMILIPGGEFLMGSDPKKDKDAVGNEQPQHTLYLPSYYLAKTPVTNAQYLDFVQATGHERPKHWEGGYPPSGKEDHPVVYVSWYDALTYCNWLAEVTGKPYCLPNEAEWEKGARGSDGRIYPWGNQWDAKRCNSKEGGPGGTTPVGAYPKGASPYVLLDMAGNVWEWTRSLWGGSKEKPNFEYPYKSEDGRENLKAGKSIRRVMRGGEFRDRDSGVRCARRHGDEPNLRSRNLGFRVMMALSFPVEPTAGLRAVQVNVPGSGAAAVGERAVAAGEGGMAVGGDVVYGDKVSGDKVAGDKIVVTGQGTQVNVNIQGENVRDKELNYLDGLLARYEYWRDHYTPLAGIAEVRAAVKNGPRLDLPMPFIPPEFEKLVEHGYGERVEVRRVTVNDLREAVAEHRRIILLGEPGSGKTTTLWRLAYDYANAARADGRAPLPVFVPLGGYTDDGPFDAYLARYLGPLASYLETYRASRRLILLLDGLNEMPRAGYTGRVDRIREVLDRQPDDVVVVTCRALDYVVRLEGLQKVEVSPLDGVRIRTFLHNYLGEAAGERLFWAMAGGDEVREARDTWRRAGGTLTHSHTALFQLQLLMRLLAEPPPLLALGRNPYLLLMTAQVYAGAGGELPANRAKLFAAFVDTLLKREEKRSPEQWIEAELQKDGLAALAYAMQAERGRGTTVEREWAVDWLCQAVPDSDAERLLYLATSATLLDADEATVRFYHQLLQEYFAALELGRRVLAGEALDRYWPPKRWWGPSGWEETAILLAGMEPDASALLEKLAAVNPVVAARCLVEGGAQVSETAQHGAVLALVNCLNDERMAPGARVQAGQFLARLGDSRPGVGLREDGLPDVVWCEVPAGPFLMGTREQDIPALMKKYGGKRELWEQEYYEREVPQRRLTRPAYYISKYPVTNAQYTAFVQDGGYTEKWRRCWTGAGWQCKGEDCIGPRTYGGGFDLPNHPVVGVSWYEAAAFCRWLTERLREAGEIEADQEVTLPTEAQWEKAARGEDSRIFPWGDEFDVAKCNVEETGIGTTSAVGIFLAGASPYGAQDMSGNVWELCRTKWRDSYREPTDEALEGDASRALRGGSWCYNQDFARCAVRYLYAPNFPEPNIGFRLCLVSQQD